MVGMDALSPADRLKMEAAKSIREDFLNQNSFDEVDTYSSLRKQYLMMRLVMSFYEKAKEALEKGANVENLIAMPSREPIGRFKYTPEDKIEDEFTRINDLLDGEVAEALKKED